MREVKTSIRKWRFKKKSFKKSPEKWGANMSPLQKKVTKNSFRYFKAG